VAKAMQDNEQVILDELLAAQGEAVDIGGYFHPDVELCAAALRPSATLNGIIDDILCAQAS